MKKIHGVEICVWDFDGTLYKQMPGLWESITESEYAVIMNHTGWSREKTIEEFKKVHKVVTPSGTKSVSLITGLSVTQAAIETSKLTKYEDFLKEDTKLQDMFRSFKNVSHYMLVNGSEYSVKKGLSLLGIPESNFVEIVTSEAMGETKPSTKGFQYLLEKTGRPPQAHLMIGDRDRVDLEPAKNVGMKTCLVWANTISEFADVVLPSVYEVPGVLG